MVSLDEGTASSSTRHDMLAFRNRGDYTVAKLRIIRGKLSGC